jgi:hypothetical protein
MRGGFRDPFAGIAALLVTFGFLLLIYASLNFEFGTKATTGAMANFGQELSRLDAVYLATGLVTTAGSNISPMTDTAKRLVVLEMLSNITLIVVLGGVYLSILQKRITEM